MRQSGDGPALAKWGLQSTAHRKNKTRPHLVESIVGAYEVGDMILKIILEVRHRNI